MDRIDEVDSLKLRLAQAEVSLAQATLNAMIANVARRYGLGDGDAVQPDGTIIRAPKPEAPAP